MLLERMSYVVRLKKLEQRDKVIEGQKETETERQRDTETERQRDRETQPQRETATNHRNTWPPCSGPRDATLQDNLRGSQDVSKELKVIQNHKSCTIGHRGILLPTEMSV